MANVVDLEVVLDEVVMVAQSRLNDRIAAVAAEKGDQIQLKPIPNDAIFIQSLDDGVTAFDPYFFVYVDSIKNSVSGPALIKNPTIYASLIFAKQGEDRQPWRKAFRYLRALEETYLTAFAGFRSGFKVSVESLVPTQFRYENASDEAIAVGVALTVAIA